MVRGSNVLACLAVPIALVALGLSLTSPVLALAAPTSAGSFCGPKEPVRDFGLSNMPPVREAPESLKKLGFGAVTMYGPWDRVMPAPSPFGYGFSERDYGGSPRLDWTVTAQLWTVDRRGEDLEEVDHNEIFIGQLNATHQPRIEVHPLADRRGFYRFDLQIANGAGAVLGSYSSHFKVVRASWHPRLRLNRDVLRPGERLLARLENHGSRTVSFGESFGVQRFESGAWVQASDLRGGPWRQWLGFLGPGGSGRCNSLFLPATTPTGLYRIIKWVGTELWPKGRVGHLARSFRVVGAKSEIQY